MDIFDANSVVHLGGAVCAIRSGVASVWLAAPSAERLEQSAAMAGYAMMRPLPRLRLLVKTPNTGLQHAPDRRLILNRGGMPEMR